MDIVDIYIQTPPLWVLAGVVGSVFYILVEESKKLLKKIGF